MSFPDGRMITGTGPKKSLSRSFYTSTDFQSFESDTLCLYYYDGLVSLRDFVQVCCCRKFRSGSWCIHQYPKDVLRGYTLLTSIFLQSLLPACDQACIQDIQDVRCSEIMDAPCSQDNENTKSDHVFGHRHRGKRTRKAAGLVHRCFQPQYQACRHH